jgi:multidrug efflux pump subunit AcrB
MIIAMGMLVDNAIVVTEGALIRLQRGEDRTSAVIKPAMQTAWPLLGATLVAAISFMPIYMAKNNTGEYCETLFLVVAISLLLSWVISMTATPVLCHMFLKVPKERIGTDPYAGAFYQNYRFVLEKVLHHRGLTMLGMVVLLGLALFGFGYVEQMFFPDSDRTYFTIEYWLPEGTAIRQTAEDTRQIEEFLLERPEVINVTACIGRGAPRFILENEPQIPNTSLGVLVVNTRSLEEMQQLMPAVEEFMHQNLPQAEPRIRPYPLGPFREFRVEARFSGPDPLVLRHLSEQTEAILRADPDTKDTRNNWRHRVKVLRPEYSQPRGRRALVSRPDVAAALSMMSGGMPVATYREDDELLPIVMRVPEHERYDLDNIAAMPVRGKGPSLPLGQVLQEVRTVWEDPIIHRYNRKRTITAQAQPRTGVTSNEVFARIRSQVEDIPLPPGYSLEWGGDYEEEEESNAALGEQMPLAFILMLFIIVALFNAFRQPLIILLTIPLALVGITVGLLVTGMPFGFMALLGTMSLFGMLVKNAVVLLDQIDITIAEGTQPYQAVVQSSISRMRPVLMASFTTVLGMIPLVSDRLYGPMAVTIMFGLSFATVLTLIVVPVLYTVFFRISPDSAHSFPRSD